MTTYILLFSAAYVSAAVSGAAGFGGALLLLPLLVATVGVTQAVPLLTIAQFTGNISRAGFGFSQIHWKPVGLFLAAAVPMSASGALAFVELPKDFVTRSIGAVILLFVTLKYFGIVRLHEGTALLLIGGGLVGFLSGLVGSAGPLGAAVFLSLELSPVAYVASEAITALVIHGVKTVVYLKYIFIDRNFWVLAGIMSIAMVLGTWSSKRIIERMSPKSFQRFVTVLLVLIASYMVING
ncbi:MAG: sulfite exporter TauE/SafE family protein [Desulfobaccales bacterium]